MATAASSRGRLARAQETREVKRRDKEYNDTLINKYYNDQRNIDAAASNAIKDDVRRRERETKERQAEHNMVQNIFRLLELPRLRKDRRNPRAQPIDGNTDSSMQTQKEQELVQLRATEESQLATAVLSNFAEEQRERGEIADLHSKHDILRDLAFKLRTAQVSKERNLQMQERELIDLQEKEYAQLSAEKLERERVAAVHAEQEKQQNRRIENFKARNVLEEQMAERVEQEAAARAEHDLERAMVDQVMAAIDEEDRLQGELKRRKAADTVQYINNFIADREERREAQRRSDFEEERKIQEHLQEVKRREEAQEAALAARREEADRIFARLKAEKEAAMAAKEEQEFLINLLHQEENEAKQRAKEADRRAFEERMKQEMIVANKKQLEMKAARDAANAAEAERLRQQMLDKFANDDRLEQMNAQKRRMKMLEHKREVDRLLEEKREMFERAQRERAEWEAEQLARQERELDLVERERRRLLRDAADLLDYLPKGVLRTREDFDYVLRLARELKESGKLQ